MVYHEGEERARVMKKHTTLGEFLVKLVDSGLKESEEMQGLKSIYGVEHLRKVYKTEKEKQTQQGLVFDKRKLAGGDIEK